MNPPLFQRSLERLIQSLHNSFAASKSHVPKRMEAKKALACWPLATRNNNPFQRPNRSQADLPFSQLYFPTSPQRSGIHMGTWEFHFCFSQTQVWIFPQVAQEKKDLQLGLSTNRLHHWLYSRTLRRTKSLRQRGRTCGRACKAIHFPRLRRIVWQDDPAGIKSRPQRDHVERHSEFCNVSIRFFTIRQRSKAQV